MQLLAHVTSYEFATGIVVLLMGVCAGCLLASLLYTRIRRRQR
jgi:hypothetical protein